MGGVDVLILVDALEALDAVLAEGEGSAQPWAQVSFRGGSYWRRELTTATGQTLGIAAAWIDLFAKDWVEGLDPACIASCGFCVGARDVVSLGDVILASQLHQYEAISGGILGKDVPGYSLAEQWSVDTSWLNGAAGLGRSLGASRPPSLESQERWILHALYAHQFGRGLSPLDPARREERARQSPDWSEMIDRLRQRGLLVLEPERIELSEAGERRVQREFLRFPDGFPADPPVRLHVGPIVTSIRPAGLLNRMLEERRQGRFSGRALGFELRSESTKIVERTRKRTLVVRGVADVGDPAKDDAFRRFACRAAARCLLSFLQHHFDPRQPADLGPQPESAPTIPNDPQAIALERLVLRNFRNVEQLELDFAQDPLLSGSWTCFAGVNGAGKSSILQAVCLLLLGRRLATQLGDRRLQRMRRRSGDGVRDAELRATLRIGADRREELFLPLGAQGVDEQALSSGLSHAAHQRLEWVWELLERQLVVSYGATRNLSERLESRHDDLNAQVARQMTLFDPLTQVASAEVLLGKAPPSVGRMVAELLGEVLGDTGLSVTVEEGRLRFRDGGVLVDAVDLPDGFRATAAWLTDLCACWQAKFPELAETGDPGQIQGIALVDEIDLHLHPALQRTLVPRLRRALPRVQWLVTTHSPLVLSSFTQGELVLLDAQEVGGVRKLDREVLGWTADQVYEWLMRVPPHSAALEPALAQERSDDAAEADRLAELLYHDPRTSAGEARERLEWRRKFIADLERRTDA